LIVACHAKTLQQMGHKPVVFAGRSEAGFSHYAVTHELFEGIPVYRVQLSCEDFDPRLVNFSHPPVDRQFEDLLVKCRADVVHMHNMIGLSLGMVHTAKRLGIPTVMTLHDFWGFCLKNTLLDADNRICEDFSRCHECQSEIVDNQRVLPIRMRNDFMALQFAEVDAFISPSRFLADTYVRAGIPRHKMHVISNGLDVNRFSRIVKNRADGLVRFTLIGFLGEHKGVQTLLDAVALLRGRGSFRVNIVGDGHLRPLLERQVQERGLSGLVKFWGKVKHSEIETVFRETDVQILASIWPENQPVSITEAMACRTPVIATLLGGNPELVRDGQTGYLVEPRSPADLARAMGRFLDAPESISVMGAEGFRRISGNTFSSQVQRIVELYEQVGRGMRPLAARGPLIACFGRNAGELCTKAVPQIAGSCPDLNWQFVMSDWLAEEQIRRAAVYWVLDAAAGLQDIRIALRCGIPLLVPEQSQALKQACIEGNCGLFYQNLEEAVACVIYLARNPAITAALGENARRFLEADPSPRNAATGAGR